LFERIVEDLANRFLSMDPAAGERLAGLRGATIGIDFLQAPFPPSLRMCFDSEGVRIERAGGQATTRQVDVSIAGTPIAFMSAATRRDFENPGRYGIRVDGDSEIALRFTRLLAELDIDWEDEIAQKIGDIPARSLTRFVEAGRHWSRQTREAVITNVGEFLREESGDVPARHEIEEFLNDVDGVRNRVDSLEVRLDRLEARRRPGSSA